jgi:plastocyanin
VRIPLAVAASLVALAAGAAAAATAALAPLTRVQVAAKEYSFTLSRRSVKAGPAIVELVNFGEDPHDLRLERVGGTHVYRTPTLQPGAYYDLSLRLLPGRYRLWCSIANHRALGMQAMLTVH